MKKEIKAIIFDIGGVIASENNLKDHYLPLCKALKIDPDEFFKLRKKYIPKASLGKISGKKAIDSISNKLSIDPKLFMEKWVHYKRLSLKKNNELIEYVSKLKSKGYKIGCLSGVIDVHRKIWDENKIYEVFDFCILSYKVGINKPDKKIYRLLIQKIKLSPQEIIVIDDMQECLDSAKELGLNTILFKTNKQLINDLKKLGVDTWN